MNISVEIVGDSILTPSNINDYIYEQKLLNEANDNHDSDDDTGTDSDNDNSDDTGTDSDSDDDTGTDSGKPENSDIFWSFIIKITFENGCETIIDLENFYGVEEKDLLEFYDGKDGKELFVDGCHLTLLHNNLTFVIYKYSSNTSSLVAFTTISIPLSTGILEKIKEKIIFAKAYGLL
jgi:hypothetical protein